jgi:hypothetical protein
LRNLFPDVVLLPPAFSSCSSLLEECGRAAIYENVKEFNKKALRF